MFFAYQLVAILPLCYFQQIKRLPCSDLILETQLRTNLEALDHMPTKELQFLLDFGH